MANIGIFQVLVIIVSLLFILLLVKEFLGKRLKKKFCVICASVTLTWLFLLALFLSGKYEDKIILALLMGQTILGIFYLVEKSVTKRGGLKKLKLFRLPFLLTLIFIAYSLLAAPLDFFSGAILIAALWLFFFIVFLFSRNSGKFGKGFIKKLIDCCRNI